MYERGRGRGGGRGARGGGGFGSGGGGGGLGPGGFGAGNRGGGAPRGAGGARGRGGGPQVFRSSDGTTPTPDAQVQSLESRLIPDPSKAPLDVSKLSLEQELPGRAGYGTRGAKTVLWTNYFRVLPSPKISLIRYAVNISPEVQNRRLRARIFKLLIADTPISTLGHGVASDFQATIITNSRMTHEQLQVTVAYRDEDEAVASPNARTYRIRLQETGSFAMADLIDCITSSNVSAVFGDKAEITQALNIIANNFPKTKDPKTYLSTRKNVHFSFSGALSESFDLGAGLQAWRGYFTSVRTAAERLLVNVQIKHGAMYKSVRLDELMTEFRSQNGNDVTKLNRFVRRVRVERLHLKRRNGSRSAAPKTICGLATQRDGIQLQNPPTISSFGANARQVQFFLGDNAPGPMQSNTYVTVYDFFSRVYNIQANSGLPVVNVGSSSHPAYLPTEACLVLPAQPADAKLSPTQTAQMIRFAVRKPFENAKSITEKGLADVGFKPNNPTLAAFGLVVQGQMLTVHGRILPPPRLTYKNNFAVNTQFGSWNMDARTRDERSNAMKPSFSKGTTLQTWSVLWLRSPFVQDPWGNDSKALKSTLDAFCKILHTCGVNCAPPYPPGIRPNIDNNDNDRDEMEIKNGFKSLLEKNRATKLLLVILPRRDDTLYNIVKRAGDLQFGIHTVCVIADKFNKPNNDQYFANVALKFNLKLGGNNHTLDNAALGFLAQGKTMVVGIDVTHPSPSSEEAAPSVAAMVASIDKDLGQFLAVLHAQKSRQEMVADLTSMLKSRLRLWQKHNNQNLPENILVYRDGVSEGQYSKVLDEELPLLRKACTELYPPKGKPAAISVIIVGKRHSTRFYPTSMDRTQIDERSSNPKNGTIVDRGITEPRVWDFYLQAHTAIQGTARPAHYFVVHDEIFRRLPIPPTFAHAADVLEHVTHNLCYMFGRATKAVSYCPPAYYADLVCERGRCYLSHLFSPNTSQAGSVSADPPVNNNPQIQVHNSIQDTMFYI